MSSSTLAKSLAAIVATSALAIGAASARADAGPFTGKWQAIDGDGSLMTLTATGAGPSVDIVLRDHYGTGCVLFFGAKGGNALVFGTGTINGTT